MLWKGASLNGRTLSSGTKLFSSTMVYRILVGRVCFRFYNEPSFLKLPHRPTRTHTQTHMHAKHTYILPIWLDNLKERLVLLICEVVIIPSLRKMSVHTMDRDLVVSTKLKCKTNEPQLDKTNKMSVCPATTQISLGIRPVWSEFSLRSAWASAQSDQSLCCALNAKLSSCGQRRLWSVWADAQADMSHRWAHSQIVCFVMSRLKSSQRWESLKTNLAINGAVDARISLGLFFA